MDGHDHSQEHDPDHFDTTPLEQARRELAADPDFIDLVDTNFHKNGLLYPANALSAALAAYPDRRPYAPDPRGVPEAREAIANYYRSRGLEVGPEQIIVTASASEGYNLLFNRMIEHDQVVSLPKPVYPLFEFIAEFNHLDVEHYTLDLDQEAQPDPLRLREEVSEQSGLLVAISPNNPTGTCLSRESLGEMVSVARERGLPILFDEVFSEFTYPPATAGAHTDATQAPTGAQSQPGPARSVSPARHLSPAQLAGDVLCITLNGVSKMFACPDLKVSWLLVTGPADLREELLSVLEIANDMYLNASSVSQAVLPSLFAHGATFQRQMVEKIRRRRDLCLSTLARSRYLESLPPDGGIHCVLRVSQAAGAPLDDEELSERILRETKVYTHPGYLYDIEGETALVVSFLKSPEELEEGLNRLIRWFER
jgi:aspartate/methionine/tyrosine aminotransferase